MFFIRFIIGNIFSLFLIFIILSFKKLFNGKTTTRFQYYIWIPLLISLFVVFLPINILPKALISYNIGGNIIPAVSVSSGTEQGYIGANNILDTTALSDNLFFINIMKFIWIIGLFISLIIFAVSFLKIIKIKSRSSSPSERENLIFHLLKEKLNIKQHIILLQSSLIQSPFSFGLYKQYIIIPSNISDKLNDTELEHIILHELIHIKHKDTFINYILCLEQALYWCNPFIRIIFSKIRQDREVYCDWSVLNIYAEPSEQLSYGYTLLYFASQKVNRYNNLINNICSKNTKIRYRIEKISKFRKANKKTVLLGISVILMVFSITLSQLPVLSYFENITNAYTPDFPMDIDKADYSAIFGDNTGSAVILDYKTNHYTVYNLDDAKTRTAPCSTFKIFSALNALEQNIITPDNNILNWNGTNYKFQQWNSNQDLYSAMNNSVNWYFQNLDSSAGIKELSEFYYNIKYGNSVIGLNPKKYWNGSSLKISPLEQVELLKNFYTNSFGFDQINIDTVKNAMIYSTSSDNNKLYGKTGTGKLNGQDVLGWFVGFVETPDNTYFFAINLKNNSGANGQQAIKVTHSIFDKMGIKIN